MRVAGNFLYTNKLINKINKIPDTEIIVSNKDHVKNVSLTVSPNIL